MIDLAARAIRTVTLPNVLSVPTDHRSLHVNARIDCFAWQRVIVPAKIESVDSGTWCST